MDAQHTPVITLSVRNMTPERALRAADDVERAISEIAQGKRKPGRVPVEALAVLIQFARNTVKTTEGAA